MALAQFLGETAFQMWETENKTFTYDNQLNF